MHEVFEPEDHFHRIISGNPRRRIQLILGSLFVLVWFGLDVWGFVLDRTAQSACSMIYSPVLPPSSILPTPNYYGRGARFFKPPVDDFGI